MSQPVAKKTKKKPRKSPRERYPSKDVSGWREFVALPELGIEQVLAKLDSGARSASLSATDIEPFESNGENWISFVVPQKHAKRVNDRVSAKVHSVKTVKSSIGVAESRYAIETRICIGRHKFKALVTLTDRRGMDHPMLLGRATIRGHFLVHPGKTHILGLPENSDKQIK